MAECPGRPTRTARARGPRPLRGPSPGRRSCCRCHPSGRGTRRLPRDRWAAPAPVRARKGRLPGQPIRMRFPDSRHPAHPDPGTHPCRLARSEHCQTQTSRRPRLISRARQLAARSLDRSSQLTKGCPLARQVGCYFIIVGHGRGGIFACLVCRVLHRCRVVEAIGVTRGWASCSHVGWPFPGTASSSPSRGGREAYAHVG